MAPEFIPPEFVLKIHEYHIALSGGSHGLRDGHLLDSAVAQPAASFGEQFLHEDLFAMAAAYLFHLVKNHPFVDGNKRVGLAVAFAFLNANGYTIDRPSSDLEDVTLAVASGIMDKDALADYFRRTATSIGPNRVVDS